jgi:hypothetical protein
MMPAPRIVVFRQCAEGWDAGYQENDIFVPISRGHHTRDEAAASIFQIMNGTATRRQEMTKRETTPPPEPTQEWAQRFADALKADFMAVVDATDWDATPAYERALVEAHLDEIDSLAAQLSVAVRQVEKKSNRIRARLQRKPSLSNENARRAS